MGELTNTWKFLSWFDVNGKFIVGVDDGLRRATRRGSEKIKSSEKCIHDVMDMGGKFVT